MATISEKKAIIELYVGWFNRVPDVEGINFWIAQFDAGSTLKQISGEFYQAAVHQFSTETGYSVSMTDDAFIAQLYDGVMGRGPTTALAPNTAEIGYWTSALAALNGDKGALLVQMVAEIKAFDSTGNAEIKAVQDKFTNKVQVAEILAISGTPLWTGTTIEQGKNALITVTNDDASVASAISTALFTATESFALAVDAATVNEGATATFTVTTNAVDDGKVVAYTIEGGVDSNDIVGGSLNGTVTITGGTATISVAVAADATTEGLETLTVSLDGKLVDASTSITDTSTDPQQTATAGADTFVGTANADSFVATQDTLGLGDTFDGKENTDTLDISISGVGANLTGFATKDVEVVKVKSQSTSASTLDMSDVKGATELKSYETEGASLTFRDIQDTTAHISIMDTDENHTINYDTQTLSGDADTITLNISEIRQPAIAADGVAIDFTQNTTNVDADIENLIVNSKLNADAPATTTNDLKTLSVGSDLATMTINGDSDLIIRDSLDKMLNTVDATTLDAKLTLDMSVADASVSGITFNGAKKDTSITFGDAANTKTITTQGGNDTIIANAGNNTVTSAAGNDTITLGAGDDIVSAGDGDDTLVDAGGNNGTVSTPIDMGAGNDTVTFSGAGNDIVDMGTGDDTLTAAAGSDSIKLGEGNDTLIMTPDDLDVSDTVDGGAGYDVIQVTDTDRITLSETQHVTKIEEFALYGGGSTLALNDGLIASVDADANGNKTFTVNTKDTEFDGGAISVLSSDVNAQPVDDFGRTDRDGSITDYIINMTNVTTPDYKFTLDGSSLGEVLITNDSGINSASELNFAGGTDTLVIVDSATIEATDSGKMTGLERIFLESSNNVAQVWEIDATSLTGILIEVSPTVPAGSVLKVTGTANVKGNANITVSGAGVTLIQDTEFEFTTNSDLLSGTDADDIFTSESVNRIQAGDVAEGNLGSDTLLLNFGIFNAANSLHQQLDQAGITEIETITFKRDLNTGISFNDVDGATGAMEVDVSTINLTDNADVVTVNDANGVTVNGYKGADTLTTNAAATLNGGDDNDTLNGSNQDDVLNGEAGDDTIIGNGGNDAANGGIGNDTITTGTGNDIVTGGEGNDVVDVSSGDDNVNLGVGDDKVTVAANDTTSNDTIVGGAGKDTLATSDVNMQDSDFTNITEMEVLTLDAPTFGIFNNEFKQSGIREINGSAGADALIFDGVTNDAHLIIEGNAGNDYLRGGSGNDTITGGEDIDIITGNTGADTIDLGETNPVTDLVVFERASDGAQTGQNVGYDVIQLFVQGTDRIVIDGDLEAALDANSLSGDFATDVSTNDANLNAGLASGLAYYTNTALQDSDLVQSNFTNVLDLLNTNLQFSAAGDNVLYAVQSTNNTGLYFYQENNGNNIIDLDEIKMLALVDSGLTGGAVAKSASVVELAEGNNLLVQGDITGEDITTPTPATGGGTGGTGTGGIVTATVDVTAANNAETNDASGANTTYNFVEASYSYTVTGFEAGDVLNLPDIPAPTVKNFDFADGAVELQWAADGNLVTVQLTGLTSTQDSSLNFLNDFDTLFGTGTIA